MRLQASVLPPSPQEDPKTKHQTTHRSSQRTTQGTQAKTTHAANNFPAKKQPENSPKTAKNTHDPSLHRPNPNPLFLLSKQNSSEPLERQVAQWFSCFFRGGISREGVLRIFQVYKKGRIIFSLITNKKLLDPCPCPCPFPSLSLSASLQGDLLSFHLCPWRGCCLLINLINKLNVFNAGNSHHHLAWRLLLLFVLFRVFAKKMCFSFAAPYSFPLFVFLLFSTRSCATSSPAGFINKSQK